MYKTPLKTTVFLILMFCISSFAFGQKTNALKIKKIKRFKTNFYEDLRYEYFDDYKKDIIIGYQYVSFIDENISKLKNDNTITNSPISFFGDYRFSRFFPVVIDAGFHWSKFDISEEFKSITNSESLHLYGASISANLYLIPSLTKLNFSAGIGYGKALLFFADEDFKRVSAKENNTPYFKFDAFYNVSERVFFMAEYKQTIMLGENEGYNNIKAGFGFRLND